MCTGRADASVSCFTPHSFESFVSRLFPAAGSRRPQQSACFSSSAAMTESEDCLLTGSSCDYSGWQQEAQAVVADVCDHVNHVSVSERLPCGPSGIYLNIETKESVKLTVEMSSAGFRICGHAYDCLNQLPGKCYETIYALLQDCSPGYRCSFSSALSAKLTQLSRHPDHRPDQI